MSILSERMPLAPSTDKEICNLGFAIEEKVYENDLRIKEENYLNNKEENCQEIKEESLEYEVSHANPKDKYPFSMENNSIKEGKNERKSNKLIENCNDPLPTVPLVTENCDAIRLSNSNKTLHKEGEEATCQKACSQEAETKKPITVRTKKIHTCEICCKTYLQKKNTQSHKRIPYKGEDI